MSKQCLRISNLWRCHAKNLVSFGTQHLGLPIRRGVLQLKRPQTLCPPRRSFHTCNSLSCLRIDPKMSITFKCDVCNEKSTKTFSKEAYQEGMVIITCPKCNSKHLISNNLTKYKDLGLGNVENFLAAKGQRVQKGLDIKKNDTDIKKNDTDMIGQHSIVNQIYRMSLDEGHTRSKVNKEADDDDHKTFSDDRKTPSDDRKTSSDDRSEGCSGNHSKSRSDNLIDDSHSVTRSSYSSYKDYSSGRSSSYEDSSSSDSSSSSYD